MKRKFTKGLIISSFIFSIIFIGLALTPHYTCACGQYEDGSQLTNVINSVTETLFGKTVIEKNPKPYN